MTRARYRRPATFSIDPYPRERHHPDRSHGPHPLPSPDMPSATRWAWECHRLLNTVPSLSPMGLTAGEVAETRGFAARSWKGRAPRWWCFV